MEQYNPKPPPTDRAEQDRAKPELNEHSIENSNPGAFDPLGLKFPYRKQWPAHYPSPEVVAPKVLAKMSFNVSKAREKTKKAVLKSYKRSRRLPPSNEQLEKAVAVLLRVPVTSVMPPYEGPPKATAPRHHSKQCNICECEGSVSANGHGQHHVTPLSEHDRLIEEGWPFESLHRKVWLCRPCHNSVHARFSNAELAACPWEETRFLMRNTVG